VSYPTSGSKSGGPDKHEDHLDTAQALPLEAPARRNPIEIAVDAALEHSAGVIAETRSVGRDAASVDTLDGFLREMKARFPDATAWTPPVSQKTDPTGGLPAIVGMKRAEAAR
jgi:hypothetical protein